MSRFLDNYLFLFSSRLCQKHLKLMILIYSDREIRTSGIKVLISGGMSLKLKRHYFLKLLTICNTTIIMTLMVLYRLIASQF